MRKNSPDPVARKKIRKYRRKLQEIDKKRPKSPDPKWDGQWRGPIVKKINKLQKELFQIKFQMNDSEVEKAWKKIKKDAILKTAIKINFKKLKKSQSPGRTKLRTPIRLGRGKSPRKSSVRFAPSVGELKQSCVIPRPKPKWSDYIDSANPPRPGLSKPKKYTSRIIMKKTRKGMRRVFQKRCPLFEPYLKRDKGHYCCAKTPASKLEVCDFAGAIKENIDSFVISEEEYKKLSKRYQKKYDSYVGKHLKGINWYMTYYCNV